MKFHILLVCSFLIFSFVANSQDCVPFTGEKNGRVQVNIASEEDCFTVKYRGSDLVAANTQYATFYFNNGVHNVKIIMSDGTEVAKKVMVSPDHAILNYNIKKKKKGKYAVKLSLFDSQLTAQAKQEQMDELDESRKKREEEVKASDKEWDDAIAKKELEREERKAKEKAEQDKLDAERDAKWAADNEETFAKKEEVNSGSSMSSGIGGSSSSIEFVLLYEEKPVCDWDITVGHTDEDAELIVASGKTNSQGVFKSRYEGLLNVPFKITGTRQGGNGEVKWSVDGFWYLNEEEVKAGKIVMDIKKFEDKLSEGGGMGGMFSSAVSYSKYGLTLHCD